MVVICVTDTESPCCHKTWAVKLLPLLYVLCCWFRFHFFFFLCRKEQWVDGQIQAQVPGLGSGAIPQRKWHSVCGYAEGTRQCKWLLCAVDCVKHHKMSCCKKYTIYDLYLIKFNTKTSYADSTSSMFHQYFVVAHNENKGTCIL